MPLYSYTAELAAKVDSGDKCQTYRTERKIRPKVGQKAHNYAGGYSAKRKHLGSPEIVDVIDVLIGGRGIIFYFGGKGEYSAGSGSKQQRCVIRWVDLRPAEAKSEMKCSSRTIKNPPASRVQSICTRLAGVLQSWIKPLRNSRFQYPTGSNRASERFSAHDPSKTAYI